MLFFYLIKNTPFNLDCSNYAGLLYSKVRAEQAWVLGTSTTCFHGNGLKLAPQRHYRNHRMTNNNILLGISRPETEAMRADISFGVAPDIWKKGTRHSLSSSSADTESNEDAPFCHLLCCRAALSRASNKFKNQRGQGDYPGSFHHLSCFWRKRSWRYLLQRKAGLVSEDLHLVPGFAIASHCGPLCSNPLLRDGDSITPLPGEHIGCMHGHQGWPRGDILKLKHLTWYKQKILREKAKLARCPGQSRQTAQSP